MAGKMKRRKRTQKDGKEEEEREMEKSGKKTGKRTGIGRREGGKCRKRSEEEEGKEKKSCQ